jgi:hypothetical protein
MRPTYLTGAAVLALATAAYAAPAHALPKTTVTVTDTTDPAAAYDITSVVLRAAKKPGGAAKVIVKHDRKVALGDDIDVWFDLDNDKVPDLHVSGSSFSEYAVHLTDSFREDGKDVSDDDCVRLSMAGRTSKVTLFPDCVGDPTSFRVAVKSSADDDDGADDWAPGKERFSKRVLAAPLS